MFFATGPLSHAAKTLSRYLRSIGLRRSAEGEGSTVVPTHWTIWPSFSTSCIIKPPSPTQPYWRSSSNNTAPNLSRALANGTRLRAPAQPAGTGRTASWSAPSTFDLTNPKRPSAPISASASDVEPSSKRNISLPSCALFVLDLSMATSFLTACIHSRGMGASSSCRNAARCRVRPGCFSAKSMTLVPVAGPDP